MHLFYPKQIKFKKAWIVSASSLLPAVIESKPYPRRPPRPRRPRLPPQRRPRQPCFALFFCSFLTVKYNQLNYIVSNSKPIGICKSYRQVTQLSIPEFVYLMYTIIMFNITYLNLVVLGRGSFYPQHHSFETHLLDKLDCIDFLASSSSPHEDCSHRSIDLCIGLHSIYILHRISYNWLVNCSACHLPPSSRPPIFLLVLATA